MIVTNLLKLILSPLMGALDGISIGVNFLLGIDWVQDVINVISYVLPWQNLLPLLGLVITFTTIRITLAIFKFALEIMPG